MSEKKVLCVGLTCLDIVTDVASYPIEDTDQRSIGQSWRRGGNATNNCTALAQLGSRAEFYGWLNVPLVDNSGLSICRFNERP